MILFRQSLPGYQFFGTIAKFYEFYCKDTKKYQHIRRIYTAVRAVIVSAYANRYNQKVNTQFEKDFTAENCITPAFQSKKRKRKTYQPIRIVIPKNIIQIRIGDTLGDDPIHSFEDIMRVDDGTFDKVTRAIQENLGTI